MHRILRSPFDGVDDSGRFCIQAGIGRNEVLPAFDGPELLIPISI